MDAKLIDLLKRCRDIIDRKIDSDADLHYQNFIFDSRCGETPRQRYNRVWAKDEQKIIDDIEAIIYL